VKCRRRINEEEEDNDEEEKMRRKKARKRANTKRRRRRGRGRGGGGGEGEEGEKEESCENDIEVEEQEDEGREECVHEGHVRSINEVCRCDIGREKKEDIMRMSSSAAAAVFWVSSFRSRFRRIHQRLLSMRSMRRLGVRVRLHVAIYVRLIIIRCNQIRN